MSRFGIYAVLIASFALAACGETKTIVIREQAPPAATAESGSHSESAAGNESDGLVSDDGTGGGAGGGELKVPNEVGKNHQAAQDDLQAHGLYNLSEEDATGQGRMLILDRNWVVVRQTPRAGTRVNEDATITLISKKYTD